MTKQRNFYHYKYIVLDHIRSNTFVFILSAICLIIGIIVGVILICGEKSYLGLLSTNNQTLFGYITGSANSFSLFYKRLFLGLLAILILFVCCLHYFSCFLAFAYMAYQSALCTLTIGSIVSLYGLSGIFNCIFLLVPANLVLFTLFIMFISVFYSRAKMQYKYKQNFIDSFKQSQFNIKLCLLLGVFLVVNIVLGLILPLIIKAIFIVIY